MAKSLLLTPGPINVPDPGAHIKSYRDSMYQNMGDICNAVTEI